jgi:hypothetical protein
MKPRFWISVMLILIGAGMAGYQSGRFAGEEYSSAGTQRFLKEFVRSADLETYLQQRGQQHLMFQLTAYNGVHSSGPSTTVCVACAAVGIVGLLPLARRKHESPVA